MKERIKNTLNLIGDITLLTLVIIGLPWLFAMFNEIIG